MEKPENPHAFPVSFESENSSGNDGMKLRDYFAAKAMQGMLADTDTGGRPEYFAKRAYEYADALLIERNKQ